MSILGSLFRPKEVKDVLYAIDHLAKSGLSECLCFNEIQSSARSAVLSSPEAVKDQIVIEGKSPLEVALTLIVNLCGRDLASGHFHTYRGVLRMNGTSRKQLFHAAQDMLVDKGFIEQADADHGKSLLQEQIKSTG